MKRGQAKAVLRSIGANVRAARKSAEMTQERLAELASLEPSFVQKIERGVTNLSVEALVALADALGERPEALFRPAEPELRRPGRPRGRR